LQVWQFTLSDVAFQLNASGSTIVVRHAVFVCCSLLPMV
jgi:hypothetical protein